MYESALGVNNDEQERLPFSWEAAEAICWGPAPGWDGQSTRTMWVQPILIQLWWLEEDREYLAAHLQCHWELCSLVVSSCFCFSSYEWEYNSLCLPWIAGVPSKSLIAFHVKSQKARDYDFFFGCSSNSSNCLLWKKETVCMWCTTKGKIHYELEIRRRFSEIVKQHSQKQLIPISQAVTGDLKG